MCQWEIGGALSSKKTDCGFFLSNVVLVATPFWQGLFPYQLKSPVAKILSVIHHRSHHKEERQNRTYSSQPLRQSVDPQQASSYHISPHPHHGLEAAHPQASRIGGQGKRQLQRQPLAGHRYAALCGAALWKRDSRICSNILGPWCASFGAPVPLFFPC